MDEYDRQGDLEVEGQRVAGYHAEQRGVPPGVRVLRLGKVHTPLHRGTCRTCDSEIEFVENAAHRVHDPRDGDFLAIG